VLLRLRRNRIPSIACASGKNRLRSTAFMGSLVATRRSLAMAPPLGRQRRRLTVFAAPSIIAVMDSLEQAAKDLDRLEQQLQSLLDQVRRLREENLSLQNRQESLVAERAVLVAKNEEARSKVEAMINRLKALEQP
jgi:cell division protein ZapB